MTYLLEDTGNRQYICTEIERARSIIPNTPNTTAKDDCLGDYIVAHVKSVSFFSQLEGEFVAPSFHNIFVFNKANIKSCRQLTPTDVIDIVVDSDDMAYSVGLPIKW